MTDPQASRSALPSGKQLQVLKDPDAANQARTFFHVCRRERRVRPRRPPRVRLSTAAGSGALAASSAKGEWSSISTFTTHRKQSSSSIFKSTLGASSLASTSTCKQTISPGVFQCRRKGSQLEHRCSSGKFAYKTPESYAFLDVALFRCKEIPRPCRVSHHLGRPPLRRGPHQRQHLLLQDWVAQRSERGDGPRSCVGTSCQCVCHHERTLKQFSDTFHTHAQNKINSLKNSQPQIPAQEARALLLSF